MLAVHARQRIHADQENRPTSELSPLQLLWRQRGRGGSNRHGRTTLRSKPLRRQEMTPVRARADAGTTVDSLAPRRTEAVKSHQKKSIQSIVSLNLSFSMIPSDQCAAHLECQTRANAST
jgi:hypothetical protein